MKTFKIHGSILDGQTVVVTEPGDAEKWLSMLKSLNGKACLRCARADVPTTLLPSRDELHRAWHIPARALAARRKVPRIALTYRGVVIRDDQPPMVFHIDGLEETATTASPSRDVRGGCA